MKKFAFALIGLLISISNVSAACYGGGTFRTCYDQHGNSYTVQKFGNMTITNGHNARTGSTWGQTNQHVGNSTFTNGHTNGRSWNMQRNYFGNGMNTYSGTDSRGRSFNGVCTKYGGCN